VEQKRVKPMADIVITKGGQPVKNYGTVYLSPANYAGYVPEDPLLDTYIPGGAGVHNTHNVTFDLTLPGINPQGLYGRYLILLFQVYPYSRYRIQDEDIAINMYKPKLFHTAHTLSHLEYQIPSAYNWLTLDTPSMVDPDAHLPGHIKSGLPATPPFEVPPLTSVPIINDMEIEYSILEFDAFLSNYSAGLEFSTDHTSRYFEWRAIQNFISGTYEAGTVLKGY
ncbi:MAG: hypothetical protein WC337_11310, partial [Candidatus Muiribacteriota bacterium]